MTTPQRSDLPLTLGTAGHIDHGKTALVAVLTGKNTDRLPEERSRGISIELGYAELELPSGRRLSVVDVPGHERFVRTMVAGASGVDLFLLCVAADDGVMPQTREHLAVLRQLGVDTGVVAITKSDLADPELARAELEELLPGVESVPVSAVRGDGVDELRAALDRAAARVTGRAGGDGPTRLHVDRSFTLRGIGTVVTGTLWSGSLAAGDAVRILPAGLSARVRSVQVHDHPRERAEAGQRVALNLAGVGWRDVSRGDVVCGEDADGVKPTYLIDATVELEPGARPIELGTRLHVHHGTREAPARIAPLAGNRIESGNPAYAQLRLEAPLMPLRGDRLVLRQLAPPDTIGGGTVVDPAPRKHGASEEVVARLAAVERGEEPQHVPVDPVQVDPVPVGPLELDRDALLLVELLVAGGREPRADGDLAEEVGLSPAGAADAWRRLEEAGRAVRVGRNLHLDPDALAEIERAVVAICERDGHATIAGVRDELGTSRRYAQAVLEHLDASKVTLRRGDTHVLRRRAAEP